MSVSTAIDDCCALRAHPSGVARATCRARDVVMLRKILIAVIVVPLAIVIVAFAVANRQMVTVSFDPFSAKDTASAASLPLFAVIFLVLILGVIVGGIAAWIGQGKWRAAARRAETQSRELTAEVAQLHRRLETAERVDAPRRTDAPALRMRSGTD